MIEKQSNFLIFITVIVTICVCGLSYYTFMIKKDYYLFSSIECNPQEESCFKAVCEEEDCDNEFTFYKVILRTAAKPPLCEDNNCPPLTCDGLIGEGNCVIITCKNKDSYGSIINIKDQCTE